MAKSDTIIGIVGAVLLVGVMVGVFMYEYRNVPDDGDGNGDGPGDRTEQTPFDGSFGAEFTTSEATLAQETLTVEEGAAHIEVSLTITPAAPGILPVGNDYRARLVDPNGTVLDSAQGTSMTLRAEGELVAGTYQIVLYTTSATGNGSYAGEAEVHYPA